MGPPTHFSSEALLRCAALPGAFPDGGKVGGLMGTGCCGGRESASLARWGAPAGHLGCHRGPMPEPWCATSDVLGIRRPCDARLEKWEGHAKGWRRVEGGRRSCGAAGRAGGRMNGRVTRSVMGCTSSDKTVRGAFWAQFGPRRLQRILRGGWGGPGMDERGFCLQGPLRLGRSGPDPVDARRDSRADHGRPAWNMGCVRGGMHLRADRLSGFRGTWRP